MMRTRRDVEPFGKWHNLHTELHILQMDNHKSLFINKMYIGAADLKSEGHKAMRVQVPLRAKIKPIVASVQREAEGVDEKAPAASGQGENRKTGPLPPFHRINPSVLTKNEPLVLV